MIAFYTRFNLNQNPVFFTFTRKKGTRLVKDNFNNMNKITLPNVQFNFSLKEKLKTVFFLVRNDYKYIMKNWLFLVIVVSALIMIFFKQAQLNPQYGFKLLPVTWNMLKMPTFFFSGILNILTFLYAGILINRARISGMDQLVDSTAVSTWSLFLSKFFAILLMQVTLLFLIIIAGVSVQIFNGYFYFDFGLYLFEIYGITFLGMIIWAALALLVQTIFTNPYLGFFCLLGFSMGISMLPELGIKNLLLRFNTNPEYMSGNIYSDINGYGRSLIEFFFYKMYWIQIAGLCLLTASLFWLRGVINSFFERIKYAIKQIKGSVLYTFIILFTTTTATAFSIQKTAVNDITVSFEEEKELEIQYKKYLNFNQPKIVSVFIEIDLFPKSQSFQSRGVYKLVNKSTQSIDTLIISRGYHEITDYKFSKEVVEIKKNEYLKFDVLTLKESIKPGDSLRLNFTIRNIKNSLFRRTSDVLSNGSIIKMDVFPRLMHFRSKRSHERTK
jgi:ABC-2 type transport system permease protein